MPCLWVRRSLAFIHPCLVASDGRDGGVLEAALRGEGVEGNAAVFRASEDVEAVAFQNDASGADRKDDESAPFGRHNLHHRGVLEFRDHARVHPVVPEPGFRGAAQRGVLGWQQSWRPLQ